MFDVQDALRRRDTKELEIHLGPDWMEKVYEMAYEDGHSVGYQDGVYENSSPA